MYRIFNVATGAWAVVLLSLSAGAALAGPKLVCEKPSYTFGEKEACESVEHTFVVKNVGDAPADMAKLRPSCGCALLSAAQDKLAPGAETSITVKVSLTGNQCGPIRKALAITSEDNADALTLTLGTEKGTSLILDI